MPQLESEVGNAPQESAPQQTGLGAGGAHVTARKPRYIVVMPESTQPEELVRSVGELKRFAATASLLQAYSIAAGPAGEANVQFFGELGAVALDLSTEERERLESGGAIVAENEIRSIPRDEDVTTPARAANVAIDTLPATAVPAVAPSPIPASIMEAYLLGQLTALRSAYDLERALRGGGGVASAAVADSKWSWCVTMLGAGPNYAGATGKGITVAVLDTGIDLQHPDFAGRLGQSSSLRDFTGKASVQDGHGHGTHCAGIVAGPVNPAGGIRYGIAPDVTLLIGKVLADNGQGSDDQILAGMTWAAAAGANIVSMSLGSPRKVGQDYSAAYERIASRLLARGVIIVAAAGNDSVRPGLIAPVENPAACPSILAISAIDRNKQVASFSCGAMDAIGEVNFASPGCVVYSSLPVALGTYGLKSGTSMATPYAAGILALYLQNNPTSSAAEDIQAVKTENLGLNRDFGRGLTLVP